MKRIPSRLVAYLTEFHLQHQGGYPFDSAVIGEEFVIAEVDDQDETHLRRYPIETLFAWHAQAKEYRKAHRSGWWDAYIETEPS